MNACVQEESRLLCRGGTSDVLVLSEGRVVKLLHRGYARSKAELELHTNWMLEGTGLPVPKACEVVERGERFGVVFERVDGESLLQMVERKPWKMFYAAKLLAELHAKVHGHIAPAEMPKQREQLERWLAKAHDFTTEERRAAEKSLALVPDGKMVCHGDMHPANILLSSRGPVIIDWSAATRGDPLVDVARTCVLFESAKLPPDSGWHMHLMLALTRQLLHRRYLSQYLKRAGGSAEQVRRCLPIQRAATSAWRCHRPE